MTARRPRLLRIRRPPNLLTAQVFEELFEREFGAVFDVAFAPLEAWCDQLLGPVGTPLDLGVAAHAFAGATANVDFICPSYEALALAPLLLALRNRARSPVRLLFIAHAVGAYSFEWAVMRPLLADGDVIIAPTESALAAIEHISPDVHAFAHAIPHPMHRLPGPPRRVRRPRIASLGRIHAQKLTHRLVEAMAVLSARGERSLHLDIGGPLDDGGWQGPHPYTRMLRERARRLGVAERVTLTGPVRTTAAKNVFLCDAQAVINLSVTIEESFGKTPVEALGVGVPVVATDWVGLRETVGTCGRLLTVAPTSDVLAGVDVGADAIADAIEATIAAPPAVEACIAHAEQFSPARVLPRYRAELEAAMAARTPALPSWPDADMGAAPERGLLAIAAPLGALGWRELFTIYMEWCDAVRRGWSGASTPPLDAGTRAREILMSALEPSLKRYFGNLPPLPVPPRSSTERPREQPLDMLTRLEHSAMHGGLLAGRGACLFDLVNAGRLDAADATIAALARDGWPMPLVAFWRVEVALARGDAARALSESLTAAETRSLREGDWPVVRQLARAARRATRPDAALPVLLAWLDRFPDSQESGPVWLDVCVNASRAPEPPLGLVADAHARAQLLLGDGPAVRRTAAVAAGARLAELLIA